MLFFAVVMALQLNIDIARAENFCQSFDCSVCGVIAAFGESRRQWAFIATCQAHNAFGVRLDFLEPACAFRLCLFSQLHPRDESRKVLITRRGFGEQWKPRGFRRLLMRQIRSWTEALSE